MHPGSAEWASYHIKTVSKALAINHSYTMRMGNSLVRVKPHTRSSWTIEIYSLSSNRPRKTGHCYSRAEAYETFQKILSDFQIDLLLGVENFPTLSS